MFLLKISRHRGPNTFYLLFFLKQDMENHTLEKVSRLVCTYMDEVSVSHVKSTDVSISYGFCFVKNDWVIAVVARIMDCVSFVSFFIKYRHNFVLLEPEVHRQDFDKRYYEN